MALAKELFYQYRDENVFFLSEKLSQDPFEEHFSVQRRQDGSSDNPTLEQFQDQELAINVMKSGLITDLKGNTSGRDVPGTILDTCEGYQQCRINNIWWQNVKSLRLYCWVFETFEPLSGK